MLNLLQETKPRIQYSAVDTRIGRAGFNNQTKQLRKIFATKARNTLPQEIVDLLQGRISQTVFMKFYYKPLLLDTRQKIIKVVQPSQCEILSCI
jgi:intergrase/recombinase